jgi:hypothetical protein
MGKNIGWVGLLWLGLAACSSTTRAQDVDGAACAPCAANQACDVATHECVDTLPVGSPCDPASPPVVDGGPGQCAPGLECGVVATGDHVCSKRCAGQSECAGQVCVHTDVGGGRSYCVDRVAPGQACNPARLVQCDSSVKPQGCITGATSDGVCFVRCHADSDCDTGLACTAPFPDGQGVCAAPKRAGSACSLPSFDFCTGTLQCIQEDATRGICRQPCTGNSGCASPSVCIALDPCQSGGASFCVAPVAVGQHCDPSNDIFCGADADCLNLDGVLVCQQNCTTSACSGNTSCHVLPAPDGGASCRSACY